MTKETKVALNARVKQFAKKARVTREYVKLSLIPKEYEKHIDPIKGFSVASGVEDSLYIILDAANASHWNVPGSMWNVYS